MFNYRPITHVKLHELITTQTARWENLIRAMERLRRASQAQSMREFITRMWKPFLARWATANMDAAEIPDGSDLWHDITNLFFLDVTSKIYPGAERAGFPPSSHVISHFLDSASE